MAQSGGGGPGGLVPRQLAGQGRGQGPPALGLALGEEDVEVAAGRERCPLAGAADLLELGPESGSELLRTRGVVVHAAPRIIAAAGTVVVPRSGYRLRV
jgi:hypothetical protein